MAGTSEHGNKLIPQKWGIFLSSWSFLEGLCSMELVTPQKNSTSYLMRTGGKAAGAWTWPFTSIPQYAFMTWNSVKAQGQLCLFLYIYNKYAFFFKSTVTFWLTLMKLECYVLYRPKYFFPPPPRHWYWSQCFLSITSSVTECTSVD
jgi:hypothetical protein